MDVLDERFHLLANCPLALRVADADELIARQRLLQDRHERAVAGQKHRARLAEFPAPGRDVQPDERLARTGHAGDEDDGLLAIGA